MKAPAAALLAAIVVGAGPAPARADEPSWPQDGNSAAADGFNPAERLITRSGLAGLTEWWRVRARRTPVSWCAGQTPPVVAEGRTFLTGPDQVGAFDTITGKRDWEFRLADPGNAVPPHLAVAGRTLLVATAPCRAPGPDPELIALDAAHGTVRWRRSLSRPPATLVADAGVAVVDGMAFRVEDGQHLWDLPGRTRPVITGGLVLVTQPGGGATAVRAGTAEVVWTTPRPWSALAGDPAGGYFLVADGPNVLRVDAATGRVRWSRAGLRGPVAADRDRVYAAGDGGAPVAVSLATGRPLWRRADLRLAARPTVAGGIVWATTAGRLRPLSPSTGADLAAPIAPARGHAVVVAGWLLTTDGSTLRAFTIPPG